MAMTEGEYARQTGDVCPFCGWLGPEASDEGPQASFGSAEQDKDCPKCRRVWTEYYILRGYYTSDEGRKITPAEEPIILSRIFDGSINIALLKDSDGTFMLSWDDGVAGDWVENYPTLSAALSRAAVLAACMETSWDNGFIDGPEIFAGHALVFTKSRIG